MAHWPQGKLSPFLFALSLIQVTWADFMAASFFGKILRSANAPVLHRFSHICQHYERVLALPRIKEAMRIPDSQADVNQNFCKPLDLKIYCVNHY